MTDNSTASLASALIAAFLVLATWTSTLAIPSAHAEAAQIAAPAHVILA